MKFLRFFLPLCLLVLGWVNLKAQYYQGFNFAPNEFAKNNMDGWRTITGDGKVEFQQRFDGNAVVFRLDPTKDKRNIWYAFIHQDISSFLDTNELKSGKSELRMEVRLMASHAPRRVNMYLSKLDQGGYLREFDIPTKNVWHTISMTTEGFVFDGERLLMVQVSLMDWGITDIYELKIDYIKVDVVDVNNKLPQYGLPLVYRPEILPIDHFSESIRTQTSTTLDQNYPTLSLATLQGGEAGQQLVMVDNAKITLLSWDFSKYKNAELSEAGQLELTTFSSVELKNSPKDFGEIRICEVFGEKAIDSEEITYEAFHKVGYTINSQTVIDSKVEQTKFGKTRVTISKPVMERLISGQTKGLAILPLGLINTGFYGDDSEHPPKLYFNAE